MGVVDAAVRCVTEHPGFAEKFRHPVKFDGVDFVEQRLSAQEQLQEVSALAAGKLHVFLERYGATLPAADLCALGASPLGEGAEVRFWLERLLREPLPGDRRRKQARRRRWVWARREMARPEGFFSEDEMRRRDPQFYQRVVGRCASFGLDPRAPMQGSLSSILMQRLEQEDCGGPSAPGAVGSQATIATDAGGGVRGAAAGGGAPPTGTNETASMAQSEGGGTRASAKDQGFGDGASEGSDLDVPSSPSSDEDEEGQGKRRRIAEAAPPDDAAVRRARFLKVMRDRFVDGREGHFDYSALDEDSELDDLVELGRDAEDKYFDDE